MMELGAPPRANDLTCDVRAALDTVHDPEYPGVSIGALGMIESVAVDDQGHARIELVPTYAACPALHFIAADVHEALADIEGLAGIEVIWLRSPVWSADRISPEARHQLGREFTVTLRGKDGSLRCPVCGSVSAVEQTAAVGPARCRALAWCSDCRNPVEIMR